MPKFIKLCVSFFFAGASNTRVTGLTVANPPSHSLHLQYKTVEPGVATDITWVKIMTWRANGDGVGLKGNAYMEDCFIRAQVCNTS